jgi:hypothetical protein
VSARTVALKLAALKAVKDHLTSEDALAKGELMDDLDPGDRKTAALPDGTKVGTVTVSQRDAAFKVTDERAFVAWVKEHRPTAIVEAVRESDQKDILERIPDTGEIPDGVELGEPGAPYVSVRQSKDEAEALVAAWRRGEVALPNLGAIES